MGALRARTVDHRADPDAAPADRGLGRRRRGVQPRPLRPRAPRRPAAQRVPAVRLGAAGLHRPPVRPAGGDAGARHAHAALRVRRPRELPAQDQGVADPQARRADDHDPAPRRADLGLGAAAGGGRRCQAAYPGAGRRADRPARHPAAGALRLEPRRVGGHRHPDRARRHRPRLHGPHRRARRRGRRAADRRRGRRRHLLLQRAAAGQRGTVRRVGRRRRHLGGRCALHGLRLRQPRLGRDLPGGADAGRRSVSRRAARPGCTRAARATRAETSTPSSRPGTPGCGTRWDRRWAWTRGRRRRQGAARGWSSSWSSAARRARSCSPTAARPRPCGSTASSPPERAPRVAARCGTSRSRCPPARPTPRATTSGCCRATTSR